MAVEVWVAVLLHLSLVRPFESCSLTTFLPWALVVIFLHFAFCLFFFLVFPPFCFLQDASRWSIIFVYLPRVSRCWEFAFFSDDCWTMLPPPSLPLSLPLSRSLSPCPSLYTFSTSAAWRRRDRAQDQLQMDNWEGMGAGLASDLTSSATAAISTIRRYTVNWRKCQPTQSATRVD